MLSAQRITLFAITILLSSAITYSSLMAQTTLTSTVLGVVTDSQGAVIPDTRWCFANSRPAAIVRANQ
jgi:hypothetical protein